VIVENARAREDRRKATPATVFIQKSRSVNVCPGKRLVGSRYTLFKAPGGNFGPRLEIDCRYWKNRTKIIDSNGKSSPTFRMLTSSEDPAGLPVVLNRKSYSQEGYCECLLKGKSQRGAIVRLLAIFESRGINVCSCSYETDEERENFGATLVLELKNNSDSEILNLVEKLMDTRIVSSIEFAPLEGRPFASFRFPIFILPGERGVVIQPELLVDSLPIAAQNNAAFLQESGKIYGHSLAKRIRNIEPSNRKLDMVIQTLKATGWGIGKCEENEKGDLTFILGDPAFGINSELENRTNYLVGMLQGLIEEILDHSFDVDSERFDGKTNSLVVRMSKSNVIS
jgi:acetolactate synthase regulatory subunit